MNFKSIGERVVPKKNIAKVISGRILFDETRRAHDGDAVAYRERLILRESSAYALDGDAAAYRQRLILCESIAYALDGDAAALSIA